MSDQTRAQLTAILRDIGTVEEVASRRSDPDRETVQMIRRLGQWRGVLIDVLASPVSGAPTPPEPLDRSMLRSFIDIRAKDAKRLAESMEGLAEWARQQERAAPVTPPPPVEPDDTTRGHQARHRSCGD